MGDKKWIVIFLGVAEGYGLAQRRVAMLELLCRGMTGEKAQEVCDLLNAPHEDTKARRRP